MKRTFATLFLFVLLVGGFVAGRAHAAQPHMQAALAHLRNARSELQAASNKHGGHRERAIQLVNDAIAQVEEGIRYAR